MMTFPKITEDGQIFTPLLMGVCPRRALAVRVKTKLEKLLLLCQHDKYNKTVLIADRKSLKSLKKLFYFLGL